MRDEPQNEGEERLTMGKLLAMTLGLSAGAVAAVLMAARDDAARSRRTAAGRATAPGEGAVDA